MKETFIPLKSINQLKREVQNEKRKEFIMHDIYWIVYIKRALSGTTKYNFKGDKERLMTFIGCYVSIEIEQTNIRYESVPEPRLDLEFIEYTITRKGVINIWYHK